MMRTRFIDKFKPKPKRLSAKLSVTEILDVLPQDPPLSGKVNLDALLDSLWGGIDNLGVNKIAFVWTQADTIVRNSPDNFKTLIECFNELALSVANTEFGIERPVLFKVFMVGNSKEFKEF